MKAANILLAVLNALTKLKKHSLNQVMLKLLGTIAKLKNSTNGENMIERIKRIPLGIGIIITLVIWGIPLLYVMITAPKFIPHFGVIGSLSAAVWLIFFLSLDRDIPDQKLPTALRCIGITEKTPNHVTFLLLEQINNVAILNGDSELEAACQAKMHEIKQVNSNQG